MVQTSTRAGHRKMFVTSAYLVLIVSFLLATVSNAMPQAKPVQQRAGDPTVNMVEYLLLEQSTGFSDGRVERHSDRLGDRVSTALEKIFNARELEDPENIRRFLPIIRNAFQYPKLIPAAYRKPRVTLPFLARLERQTADAPLREEISAVAECVKQQTRPRP
jgi:hypothetical protein